MNNLFESLSYKYLKIFWSIAKVGTIATSLVLTIPSMVMADGIYMTNMKTNLTQSSIDALTDSARTPGIQSGDIVEYVVEAQVGSVNATGGPGVYFTAYIPSGVEVLGAWFVTDVTGTTVRDPGVGGQANDGWGARGSQTPFGNPFSTAGNSRQSDLYGDTGIFYSTDSRTQLFTADGSNIAKGPVGNPNATGGSSNGYNVEDTFYGQVDAFNRWDGNQVTAFGRGGTLDSVPATNTVPGTITYPSATIINSVGRGTTPFGSGSVVAGADTGYTLDNTGSIGPWKRIQYPGSTKANITDGAATGIGAANTATLDDASALGTALNDTAPLDSMTNAIRWSDGLRTANEKVYVKIRVKVNASAISAASGVIFNFEATGSDNHGSGSKDNPWRYFGPTTAQSANLYVKKEIAQINGVAYSSGNIPPGATVTY
jgi:large repetitive protein